MPPVHSKQCRGTGCDVLVPLRGNYGFCQQCRPVQAAGGEGRRPRPTRDRYRDLPACPVLAFNHNNTGAGSGAGIDTDTPGIETGARMTDNVANKPDSDSDVTDNPRPRRRSRSSNHNIIDSDSDSDSDPTSDYDPNGGGSSASTGHGQPARTPTRPPASVQ